MTETRKRRRNWISYFHGGQWEDPRPTEKELDKLEEHYNNLDPFGA